MPIWCLTAATPSVAQTERENGYERQLELEKYKAETEKERVRAHMAQAASKSVSDAQQKAAIQQQELLKAQMESNKNAELAQLESAHKAEMLKRAEAKVSDPLL
jgi:hypothetical protein